MKPHEWLIGKFIQQGEYISPLQREIARETFYQYCLNQGWIEYVNQKHTSYRVTAKGMEIIKSDC